MRSKPSSTIILTALVGLFWVSPVFARGSGGDYTQTVEAGLSFHTGDITNSMTGANGYIVELSAEKRVGVLRPEGTLDLEMASGANYVAGQKTTFSMYGASFLLGENFFPFTNGRLQPYVGFQGVLGWNYMQLPPGLSGIDPQSQSLSFGYALGAGVDLRPWNADGRAIRIHGGYWAVTSSSLADQSGYVLNGFRFLIGIVY